MMLAIISILAAFAGFQINGLGAGTQFTPLHTYYISASGSDGNNGTSPATPWATPNHAIVCGDVIIAAAGTYNGDMATWGAVSNCPSTTGGIDGAGGIYAAVLLCGASDLGTGGCIINCATAACNAGHVGSGGRSGTSAAMNINSNYWAIEGWNINGNGAGHRGIQIDSCFTTSTVIHHIISINNVIHNAGQAFDSDDCGYGFSPTDTNGGDYFAALGMLVQSAAQDTICLGAIDAVAPGVLDTNSGTHIYFYTNYSYAHTSACSSDVEDYLFDTWDAHNAAYQGVIANNIGYATTRMCIQVFQQTGTTGHAPVAPINIYNNTCFQDNVSTGGDNLWGEINLQASGGSVLSYNYTVYKNIAYQPLATSAGGGGVSALLLTSFTGTMTIGGSGTQNVLRANNSSCKAGAGQCNSTFDAEAFSPATAANLGTNTYSNPSFTNTTDLLANQVGAPNCTGYATTTACAGYNVLTQTLTTPSIISDLQATGFPGAGFQLPSATCAANADYPSYLKGLNRLQWNSGNSTITVIDDLASKPCGM